MTNTTEPTPPIHALVQVLNTAYGPYAFGVCSLLLIWFTIVQPELRANKLDFDTFNKSLVTMQQIGSQQEAISQALSVNARQLERMIDRLEEDKK
jgi:hypothetical protein